MATTTTHCLQPKTLFVEGRPDYALDYELMLSGYGYDVVFAPRAAAAGLAVLEYPETYILSPHADMVEAKECVDVIAGIRAVRASGSWIDRRGDVRSQPRLVIGAALNRHRAAEKVYLILCL